MIICHGSQPLRLVCVRLGMVGILHTWTRPLLYHPHVNYIVTGGGLTDDGRWRSSGSYFLVPVKELSLIFRAKFCAQLIKYSSFIGLPWNESPVRSPTALLRKQDRELALPHHQQCRCDRTALVLATSSVDHQLANQYPSALDQSH